MSNKHSMHPHYGSNRPFQTFSLILKTLDAIWVTLMYRNILTLATHKKLIRNIQTYQIKKNYNVV